MALGLGLLFCWGGTTLGEIPLHMNLQGRLTNPGGEPYPPGSKILSLPTGGVELWPGIPGVYVAEKIRGNRFRIAGGKPGLEVCRQVTGIRQDAFANANRVPVEETGSVQDRGYYLNPEAFGRPESRGIDAKGRSEKAQRIGAAQYL